MTANEKILTTQNILDILKQDNYVAKLKKLALSLPGKDLLTLIKVLGEIMVRRK